MTAEQEVELFLQAAVRTMPSHFADHVFVVGGFVRDQIMGISAPKDIDLVVDWEGGAEAFALAVHSMHDVETSHPVRMGAGYPIWQITFKDDVVFNNRTFKTAGAKVEIADTMTETFPDDSTRQRITLPGTLEQDIMRRDFACNSLVKNLNTGRIIDFGGQGLNSIRHGVLMGNPHVDLNDTFRSDPLRMLRAIRFASKFDWRMSDAIVDSIKKNAFRIKIVSMERIRDELIKLMDIGKLVNGIFKMREFGLLELILPEVQAMHGVEQGVEFHSEGCVFTHTLFVMREAKSGVIPQLSAMLHDIGKPTTRNVVEGNISFHGHEGVGAKMVVDILHRLKFDSETIDRVAGIVGLHLRPMLLNGASNKAVRRFVRDAGDLLGDVLDISEADEKGSHGKKSTTDNVSRLRERIASMAVTSMIKNCKKAALDGNEIMKLLHVKPGPVIREVTEFLLDMQDEMESPLAKEDAERAVLERFGVQ